MKIDIEGAEVVVFDASCSSWLNRVETIAIELHDDSSFGSATEAFFNSVKATDFEFSFIE